ncbi:MRP4 protein, partial [Acromyrmex insinuator]
MYNIEIPSLFNNVIPRETAIVQDVKSSTAEDTNNISEKLNFEILVSTYSNISLSSRSWIPIRIKCVVLMQSLHVGMRIRLQFSSLSEVKRSITQFIIFNTIVLLWLNTAAMNQTGDLFFSFVSNLLLNNCLFKLTGFYFYLQTAIIGTIMWQKVSISSFVSIRTLLIIVLSGQGTLSFLNFKLRTMIASLTDRRMQLMSELIAGIQAWEKPFSQIVSVIRKLEIKFSSYVHATYLAIIVFTERDFLLMDEVNTRRFSEITPQLQFKSQKPKEESNENLENQIDISRSGSIVPSEHQRLSDLPVKASAGQLCAVGSGKSSILHLLLKKLNPGAGSIIFTQDSSKYNFSDNLSTGYFTNNLNLRISYASQELWLFGGTVRDNILFGQSYDKARYMQVANVCALTKDFQQFLQGDMTLVGDRSGFVKMQGNYNELVQSNKDFIEMLDSLNQAHRKEEENMRRASEMSKRITITKRISRLSITKINSNNKILYYFAIVQHSDIDDSDYVENISSSNLHNIMFFKLLQARMSFFHNNSSGEILNRFSKDMGIMDEWLSKLILEARGFE